VEPNIHLEEAPVTKMCLLIKYVLCFSWQDVYLGEYLGVNDGWMDVIASQGPSLLAVDVSGSNVTDNGLRLLKDCLNLQALTLNYCDQFSEQGLKHLSGRWSFLNRIITCWKFCLHCGPPLAA
jgi:hypothetical protein